MVVSSAELRNPRSAFEEFKAFLVTQNVLALAIAVVVGAALNGVVQGLVDDFIMPIVAAATPGGDWAAWKTPGPIAFKIGHFLSAVLNFVIVAFVAWRITKALIKPAPAAAAPTTKPCQYCRMSIDAAATRCAHCTSQL
ncbi:MAG: MscL family protein [Gemmatimonadaceae bacterium]